MKKSAALFALVLLGFATTAWSGDEKPAPASPQTAIVKYRHNVMEGMAKHMGAAGAIVKGEVTGRNADLVGHAEALHALGRDLPGLFPDGTGPDNKALKTDAKPEVWTKKADFETASKKYLDETAKLVEVAKGGDLEAFKAQFGAVGKSCGGCHDNFRVDD
jgi:cytochrome c556